MSAMPSSILLKRDELNRQYSYEHTLLGRYRLDPAGQQRTEQTAAGPALLVADELAATTVDEEQQQKGGVRNSEQLSIQSAGTKKSVRFQDLFSTAEVPPKGGGFEEEKEEEERERRTNGGPIRTGKGMLSRTRHWAREMRQTFSWKSLRLMLIDWLFLAILGIGMALTSMFLDLFIEYLQTFQLVLINVSGQTGNPFLDYVCTYLSWLGYTELLVICSAIFVHYVAPQAVGSGIPEMKTILRGVILKDFLSARTLVSKVVGLAFSLGSGIPIGKMGPFVHVAANYANLLSNLAARFEGAYGNECRKSEMVAAACATGVACCFSAPVGGVLFSIEVTTMYFSVRNYWRGFFAAACGATVFRLLRVVVFGTEVTLVAFYQTHFPEDAFEPEELPFFALIGLLCGFIGAGFIVFYRSVVMFLRQNAFAKKYIQKNWLLYPVLVAFLVATVTYPRGYGRFLSGRYKFTRTILDFFSNCTWSKGLWHPVDAPHGCPTELLGSWTNHEGYGPYNVFLVLTLFTFTFLFLSALCNTMPIPCGMFMPLFVVGAAFGRLIGEIIASIYPEGIPGGTDQPIFPGIYAVVGAAALTGAITHSVSVAMICCEITGQLIYIIPLMIAVIIANAVCAYMEPSVYDVMIGIKHLPYLPDIPPSNAEVHLCTAENIMEDNVRYLCRVTKFKEIRSLLGDMPRLRSFPVVDDPSSMMLLGSISRRTLLDLLNAQIGDEARRREAERRIRLAIETIDKHFREAQVEEMKSDTMTEEQQQLGEGAESRKRVLSQGAADLMRQEGEQHWAEHMSRCALSETALGSRWGLKRAARKHSKGARVYPMVEEAQQQTQEMAARKQSKKSRFSVEPVLSAKRRHLSGGSTAPPVSGRAIRRNAFAITQGKMSDGEVSSDSANTPPKKKTSCPDLRMGLAGMPHFNGLDHQSSLSRSITDYVRSAKKRLRAMQRHRESEEAIDYDLHDDERREWELAQLERTVEIDEKLIDPAPFQLVRRTSVYKVHSVFSLLDLNRAYVTDRGRLVGVVALRDLRIAIQNAQNGIPMHRNFSDSNNLSSEGSCTEASSRRQLSAPANSPPSGELPTDLLDLEKGANVQPNGSVGKVPTFTLEQAEEREMGEEAQQMDKDVRPCSLQMIQEENEPSRLSSPSYSRSSSLKRRRPTRLLGSPVEGADGCTPTLEQQSPAGDAKEVARAVAYLRRKSVALEDLKQLEETPLPDTQNIS